MTTDTQPSPPFSDPKNITVGNARVIYGPYRMGSMDFMGANVWHLPGGTITTDEYEARAYAVRMDQVMRGISQ